ncbi:UpxY family transcription antiterminator [Dysgonomonas sp.]
MYTQEKAVWYAMRATFRKELDAQNILDKEKIRSFIPMCYTVTLRNQRKVRELVPAVRNLIFVYATLSDIKKVKTKVGYLQYIVNSRSKEKIIVPDEQMKRFIGVASTYDQKLIYLKPEEVNLKQGTPVRIIGGSFDGVEGVFMKVKGARSRRVVVLIHGVTAVATAEIEPDLVQVIP